MRIKDLFIIILKVIGFFFVRFFLDSAITFIATVITFQPKFFQFQLSDYVWSLLLAFSACCVSFLIAYFLIFKTAWIADKLRLDKGFSENEINLSIHRSVILSIALIVLGGVIMLNEIPVFIKLLITKYELRNLAANPLDTSLIIFSICKLVIGAALIYYQQFIVNNIEYRRTK
ncbi:MAG TPA: hypothetical protein VGB84_05070 [Arachidicoccus sp.]